VDQSKNSGDVADWLCGAQLRILVVNNSHCNNIFEVSVVLSEEPKDPKPPRLEIPEGAASKYTSGVFSSLFYLKNFEFWLIILQNRTKHYAKILVKRHLFSILDFGLKRQKKKPKSQKSPTHPMKNLAFWMELNTPMKNLAFCISSFQSSWHFAFHRSKVVREREQSIL
jgi:hypothetical protein